MTTEATVKKIPLKAGGCMHKVLVRAHAAGPGAAIDHLAAHLPDPKEGAVRRLLRARTNRAGTLLVALVLDTK